jgi:hypothetical protein
MGKGRGVPAAWLKKPHSTDCGTCGDFAVSILQLDWPFLQSWRGAVEAIQQGFRIESSVVPVVAPNRPSQ